MARVTKRCAYADRPKYASNLWQARLSSVTSSYSSVCALLSYPDERMLVAQLQSEDTVAEIMPIDDHLASPQSSHEPYKRKSWDAGWVLSFDANVPARSRQLFSPRRWFFTHK